MSKSLTLVNCHIFKQVNKYISGQKSCREKLSKQIIYSINSQNFFLPMTFSNSAMELLEGDNTRVDGPVEYCTTFCFLLLQKTKGKIQDLDT